MIDTKIRTARKVHRCEAYAREPHDILPGERYIDEVLAPWTIVADDVDDDGRTIGAPHGSWEHFRRHLHCEP